MKVTKTAKKVTVIIPIYNAARYLQRCLDSVYEQTYQELDIIAVNDGSSDESLAILRENANQHKDLTIIDQKNHGQGHARNRALKKATGEYILFVDADDYIDPSTLKILVAEASKTGADAVHCGWKASDDAEQYSPRDIFDTRTLTASQCDEFLRIPNYFSVNSLYRRAFLRQHGIYFGEGYIYEDNEFIVQVATSANKISFVDDPLYVVHFGQNSSTRTASTDKHYKDFLSAVEKSFAVLESRLPESKAYLASYFLEKFIIYYQRRVPRKFKRTYLREFVNNMSDKGVTVPKGAAVSKFLRMCARLKIFTNRRYRLFGWCVFYKTRILPVLKS
ncbi:MAG TPA: glycosyltransferase [Candidatus Saccharimonadales bacterium]